MGKIKLAQTGAEVQSDLNFTEKMFTVYDPSSTYAKDNVVRYGDKLYKCKQNSTTGTWDSSKWDEVKLNNLLGGTKLYKHRIVMTTSMSLGGNTYSRAEFSVISTRSSAYDNVNQLDNFIKYVEEAHITITGSSTAHFYPLEIKYVGGVRFYGIARGDIGTLADKSIFEVASYSGNAITSDTVTEL